MSRRIDFKIFEPVDNNSDEIFSAFCSANTSGLSFKARDTRSSFTPITGYNQTPFDPQARYSPVISQDDPLYCLDETLEENSDDENEPTAKHCDQPSPAIQSNSRVRVETPIATAQCTAFSPSSLNCNTLIDNTADWDLGCGKNNESACHSRANSYLSVFSTCETSDFDLDFPLQPLKPVPIKPHVYEKAPPGYLSVSFSISPVTKYMEDFAKSLKDRKMV